MASNPLNGGAGSNGQATDPAAELERRKALDRDRNKRWRDNRLKSPPGANPAAATEQRGAPAGGDRPPASRRTGGAPPVHSTRPLSELGQGAENFRRAAPAVESVEPEAPPDTEGAKKFAALIAVMFRVALDDASQRYDLSRFAGELGAELGDGDVDTVKRAAVTFVFEHAERCALKHGFGLTVPWEDELVTLGAGAGSMLYLIAKFTGRLDHGASARPTPSRAEESPAAPPFADDDSSDSDFAPLRVERGGAGR